MSGQNFMIFYLIETFGLSKGAELMFAPGSSPLGVGA